jgi:hypothetical protein
MVDTPRTPETLPRWRRWAGNFYVQLGAAYAVVAVVVYLRAFPFRSHYGGKIWLTPLHAYWDPRLTLWILPAAAAAAVSVILVLWAVKKRKTWVPPLAAALAVTAVNFAPGGGRKFPFDWLERALVDARILFQSPDVFAGYVEATRAVSCHCRTRPGLLYWILGALDRLCAHNVYAIEIVIIAAVVASVPLLYFGARAAANKDTGLTAAALFAVAPAFLIFGPGLDGVNCLIGTAVIVVALKAATSERGRLWSVAAGVLLAIALTTSYLLIVLIIFAAAFIWAGAISSRRRPRATASGFIILAAAAAVLVVFQAATGYDHIAAFKRAYWVNQELPSAGPNVIKLAAQALGLVRNAAAESAQRPYRFFVFGNIYSLFVMMGVPAAVLYYREMARIIRDRGVRRSFYGAASIGFLLVFLVYNFSGLTLGEVERVWLFLVPGFLIPAGSGLLRLGKSENGKRLAGAVFTLTIAQALIYNVLLTAPF